MHQLPLPKTEVKEVHVASYSRIRRTDLKNRHERETTHLSICSSHYIGVAEQGRFESLESKEFQPINVTAEEMSKLYNWSVQPSDSAGRQYYDELMSAVPHEQCPYCGERRIKSIDHYLPKKKFSALAVTPQNLVPACSDCNHYKGDYLPNIDKPALLHPYFDDVDNFRWLYAIVTASSPPAIHFEVKTQYAPSLDIAKRVKRHFEVFRLGDLFKSHAGQVVQRLDLRLLRLFINAGAEAVKEHLLEEAEFQSDGKLNTWQRALYEGLASSHWYCGEYFTNPSRW